MPVSYTQKSGGGFIEIRDYPERNDGLVEFYVAAGSSQTFSGRITYTWSTPNGSGSGEFAYAKGAGTKYIRGAFVTKTGPVTFSIGATGTSGLGGPTTITRTISRVSGPNAPGGLALKNIKHDSADILWTMGALNGGTFIENQVQVSSTVQSGLNNFVGTVEKTVQTTGNTINVTGLLPGRRYYFHVRTRSSLGWGAWSTVAGFNTVAGLRIKVGGVWKLAIPYVKHEGEWKPTLPFVKDKGVWKGTVY